MRRIATWTAAAAATAALLGGGLSGTAAYAEAPAQAPAKAAATTLHLRYAAKSSTVTVAAGSTVGGAISQLHLKVDGNDRVKPGRSTKVSDGMSLVIDRVSVTKTVKKQTVRYKTIKKKTKSMMKGQKKLVRKGLTGKVTRTYVKTTVNGRTTTRVVRTEQRHVRARIMKVGTNPYNLAHLSQWNRIARCESGGNWKINTGNGYYGGLQFNLATWRAAGGAKFAKYPNQASKNEQIHIANKLYAKRGFSPWSCKP